MKKRILITGGAGFIGSNAAKHFMGRDDCEVLVFDNLSRNGTDINLQWLKGQGDFTFIQNDIRDFEALKQLFETEKVDAVIHLAAQVAVTTSIVDPREDFDINALGTFNLLEAIRLSHQKPFVIYTSTNKVYGGMEDIEVVEENGSYTFRNEREGISETRGLDFHSPYGCSKGAADQYVRDYFRIYGIPTVVFRQSCIYGYRQFGIEDQGWVAWFIIAALMGRKITVYGDGKQVRDILFIDDLVSLFDAAITASERVSGKVYNIGGGPGNRLSLLELLAWFKEIKGLGVAFDFDDWRAGDQPVYFSNISKIKETIGWEPAISKMEGLEKLYSWVEANLDDIRTTLAG